MADFGDTMFGNQAATDYYNQLQAVSSANNAFNAAQAEKQMKFQEQANAKAMDFNARQAEMTRSWQEMMSNTAYQRQVKDMVAAGLNPVLGVSNSGAAVPSGATASGAAGSGAKAEADTTMASAFSAMVNALVQGQTARDVAEINARTSMHNAELSAQAVLASAGLSSEASKYGSGLAAAASKFASQLSHDASVYATEHSDYRQLGQHVHEKFMAENFPNSWAAYIPALLSILSGDSDTSGIGVLSSLKDAAADYAKDKFNQEINYGQFTNDAKNAGKDYIKDKNKKYESNKKYNSSSYEYGKYEGRPKYR